MSSKPLQSTREAYSEVQQEESRKKVMMGSQNSTPTLEGSALAAQGFPSNNNPDNHQRKG